MIACLMLTTEAMIAGHKISFRIPHSAFRTPHSNRGRNGNGNVSSRTQVSQLATTAV